MLLSTKKARHALGFALLCVGLSGCMGQMGLSGMLTKGNLSVVDNRYGRAGVFMLLSPVYGLAASADLFVFNTIEFWTGKNPITGKAPALVDQKANAVLKLNQHVDPALKRVPLAMLPHGVRDFNISYLDDQQAQMEVFHVDGRRTLLRGEKFGDKLFIYENNQHVATLTQAQLATFEQARAV